MSDEELDKMVKDLMNESDAKITLHEMATIIMCGVLWENCKKRPDLKDVARKKIISELEQLNCYKEYMKNLTTNN